MDINDWFSLKCYGSLKNQIRRIFSLTCLNWNDSKQIYPWQNCNMHSKISNHICLKHFWYSNHLFKFILKSSRLENVGKCLTIPCLLNWSIFFFSRIDLPVSVNKNIRPNEFILTGRIDTKVKTIFYILEAKVWLKIDFLSNQK